MEKKNDVESNTRTVTGVVVGDISTSSPRTEGGDWSKGEKQAVGCRDPIFAVLLYINVGALIAVAGIYGGDALRSNTDENDYSPNDYSGYAYFVGVTGVFSILLAGFMLWVLMRIPKLLIKTSLLFSVIVSGLWFAFALLTGSIFMAIMGLFVFMIMCCYARLVWGRIPFATVNLVTACTAVRGNLGIGLVAYFMSALAFAWSIIWVISFVGVMNETESCEPDESSNESDCSSVNYGYLFLLFISFFFTHQVIQNTVHTTTAGVLGTWWFVPDEAGSCCSAAVRDSFCRSTTTSFGSICFGSLIVAIVRALEALARSARDDEGGGILACIAVCILSCIGDIIEYFNKWAYIYVGLYGYSYLEAGKNVFTLFKNRGWEAIIADDLVGNTLFFVSVVVGGIAGVVGIAVEQSTDWFDKVSGDQTAIAWLVGFIVGLVICSILMSVIGSAVNAVIVLFAEAPAEFQQNHPQLSQEMRDVWLKTYPGCL